MPKNKEEDCPFKLVTLTGKPKAWREEASKVLIEYWYELKSIKKENKITMSLLMLILGCLVKLAFFP